MPAATRFASRIQDMDDYGDALAWAGKQTFNDNIAVQGAGAHIDIDTTDGDAKLDYQANGVSIYTLGYFIDHLFLTTADGGGFPPFEEVFRIPDGTARFEVKQIRAISSAGLKLFEEGGTGIYVQDAGIEDCGNVGINCLTPSTLMEMAHSYPYFTFRNTINQDIDGGRESLIVFRGEQSGNEKSTLAKIQASHDGTGDDQKGDLIFYTNDGTDDDAPTEAMRIDSAQNVGIGTPDPSSLLDVSGADAQIDIDATTGNPDLEFQENTTWMYKFYYDVGNDRFAFRTTNSDGSDTNADLARIADGQTTIDANTTWDENVFDYVCQACGWHHADKHDTCPECGGPVGWQDDAALVHNLLHAPDKSHFLRTMEKQGLVDMSDAIQTDTGYKNVFMPLQTMQQFTLSAIAQLWRRIEQLEVQLA